jgi:bifunctional non-homologous end joining protein LigD
MLATARALPASGRGYGWEWKYDGGRAIARIRADGQVRLDSRNAKDFTPAFPEIVTALGEALLGRRVSLDGELIAVDPATGVPDFGRLQHRFGTRPSAVLLAEVPVSYVVFDLLHLDADPTTRLPYTDS